MKNQFQPWSRNLWGWVFLFVWSVSVLGAGDPQKIDTYALLGGQSLPELPRAVAEWDPESLGNHRAVVEVNSPAEVVWARIAWRRVDPLPELKGIVITSEKGTPVKNIRTVDCLPDFGDILFEAKEAGKYYVYYMPYRMVKRDWNPFPDYFQTATASASWSEKTAPVADIIAQGKVPPGIERAAALALESNGERNAFVELEIPATEKEAADFLSEYADRNVIFFQEPVSRPIRMTKRLPLCWLRQGPSALCKARGGAGQYVVFQLGAVATQKEIPSFQVGSVGLRNEEGELLGSLAARCFNLSGNDSWGGTLTKDIPLRMGEVLPLWMAIAIPADTPAGVYKGELVFSGWNLKYTEFPIELEVVAPAPEGSSLERLRWLDSTIGTEGDPLRHYPDMTLNGKELTLNRHTLTLSENGLPGQIGTDLLAQPMEFRVKTRGDWLVWTNRPVRFDAEDVRAISWQSVSHAKGIILNTDAQTEADGFMTIQLELNTLRDCEVEDAQLVFSFEERSVPYFMGLGIRGGARPMFAEWQWSKNANQCFWIGSVTNGLYCKLLDRVTRQDLYFMDEPYRDWRGDQNEGRIDLRTQNGRVELSISTGALQLVKDEERIFRFHLMLTPFGQRRQSVNALKMDTCGVGNILKRQTPPVSDVSLLGYDAKLNPYLNDPFPVEDDLKALIEQLHAKKQKAHFVIGTREIPFQVAEFWPLWSLNHEIFTYSAALKGAQELYGADYAKHAYPYIGTPWLCEHFGEGYSAFWFSQEIEGEPIVTLGINPRGRWQNYYLETVRHLLKDLNVDGIRTDLNSRRATQRLRCVLDETRPDALLDAVTGNNLRVENGMVSPMVQYMEHLSMLDSIEFTDGFSYGAGPDYYLVELSGAPFGVNTSFHCGNPGKALLYGSLARKIQMVDPGLESLWKFCDEFGLKTSLFVGYWDESCPVQTGEKDLFASVYAQKGRLLIVYFNMAEVDKDFLFNVKSLKDLGFDPETAQVALPDIPGFQQGRKLAILNKLTVSPGQAVLLLVSNP